LHHRKRSGPNWSIPGSSNIAAASSKPTGDGLSVEFASVVDAVCCAVDILGNFLHCRDEGHWAEASEPGGPVIL
jgi:hypothetical protein